MLTFYCYPHSYVSLFVGWGDIIVYMIHYICHFWTRMASLMWAIGLRDVNALCNNPIITYKPLAYLFTVNTFCNFWKLQIYRISGWLKFIQYFARNWSWYSLRGLHIRINWFSLYGIRIPLFSSYGIHMALLPYMVIQPIVLGIALLLAAMDSSLSQGPLLWRHNDMTVIASWNTRGRERDTRQRLDNANARRSQTVNR